ncbi:MAG TPA: efflux RND transporter permease subunit [Steroidobacteraceae bacterium]|nr:efflux RND transporter permease subunit [Steroidobacteraceae bacterium]
MKNISAWAIKHPVTPVVLFVVLFVIGIVAFVRLPINQDPDIDYPLVQVSVSQPGAAPREIETQIIQKIEGSVASLGSVHTIRSTASEGEAYTQIEFQIGTPIDRAVTDVRDAVAKVRSDLPEGIDEPLVRRIDVAGGAIVFYGVSTTAMTEVELSWFVDNALTKRLVAVPGVAQVQRWGGVDREIRVELDPARMQALGITAAQVNQQLRQLNIDAPGGRAQVGGGEQAIRVLGGAQSALDLGNTQITLPGGVTARLKDIAEVHDGAAEVRVLSRLNGRPATVFAIYKSMGSSEVDVLGRVQAELAKVATDYPNVKITQVFTTVELTKKMYRSALEALIEGSLLAVAVVWLFLRDMRATAISALAIPLAAVPTFAFMYMMNFTLNQISLLALSLVAGVLVDDAIVEIENIVRHMRMGKSGYQAALDAADQIGLAVVATSSAIIAVFLPVSFMPGVVGQFFKQFGLTVAAAVFFSLLVARLVTPVIAAFTLKGESMPVHHDGPFMHWYLNLLRWCIKHRWRTLGAGTAFFALSIAALMVLPRSVIPEDDNGFSSVNIELPPGVRLEDTAVVSNSVYEMIAKRPEVQSVIEFVGDNDDVRTSSMFIELKPRSERKLTSPQFEKEMTAALRVIPDARITFQKQSGSGASRDITLFLTGDDTQLVEQTAQKAVQEMRTLSVLKDPRINGDLQRPEILIRPRLDLAAELGVTVQSISQTIRIATLGDLPQNGAKFSLADRQIPIRVSLLESSRRDLSTLQNLPVPAAGGRVVPLKSVAEISFGEGPSRIRRYNQSRRVALEADLNNAELDGAMKKLYDLPTFKHLPPGVRVVETGDAELMTELFTSFSIAMGTGILMVFAVLVLLFARVFQPITILSALPLSIGGAAVALLATQLALSLSVVIGFLMLMGIVAKNSILLVDFAIEEMRAGRDRVTALIESGHKRARPIVMTTVAMVAGMLPVALALGDGSQFRAAMAIAVIGGLVTSTALTLVIVPAAFTLVDDVEQWLGPRVARALMPSANKLPVPTAKPDPHPAN